MFYLHARESFYNTPNFILKPEAETLLVFLLPSTVMCLYTVTSLLFHPVSFSLNDFVWLSLRFLFPRTFSEPTCDASGR